MIREKRRPETDPNIVAVLRRGGVVGLDEKVSLTALTGGVSSGIWKFETQGKRYCVKRPLNRLNVEAEWIVPVERSTFEARWYQTIDYLTPGLAPRLIHADKQYNSFVMDYLEPDQHDLWKDRLMAGDIRICDAANVGAALAATHRATALNAFVAKQFESQHIFHDIRLEPYLLATIQIHPDLGRRLKQLAERTSSARKCLIHGDVSPKNIMIANDHSKGEGRPVFLDAECATYGDPAFDLAFCLNHLLLKRTVNPDRGDDLRQAFAACVEAYMARVVWEPRLELERRAAGLLPALALARVDGKSPVEYIDDDNTRLLIREVTRPMISTPPANLHMVLDHWHRAFEP